MSMLRGLKCANANVLTALALGILSGCGSPMLELGPQGWRVPDAKYTIASVEGNRLMPDGWLVSNYEKTSSSSFEKQSGEDDRDLELRRTSTDGLAVIASEPLPASDFDKSDQALAERFVRIVSGAGESEGELGSDAEKIAQDFAGPAKRQELVSKVKVVTSSLRGDYGVGRGVARTQQTYSIRVVRQTPFEVPGGHGCELEVERMPLGASDPDRKYYAAILRSRRGFQYVAVLYGDVPSSYASGGEQMAGLTRRFHF